MLFNTEMVKVRKWYSNLEKHEEERYWACFQFLYMMNPDDNFTYIAPGNYLHHCKSKHDEIVAIHATCCVHRTNFFGHFHRNYLIYVELYLNKADWILRGLEEYQGDLITQHDLEEMRK